jgi:alpha-tubulin suppressor-like RCC1 family protein
MSNYRAQYQSRAVAGLAAIGSPAAKQILRDARDRAKDGVLILRGDVRAQLDSIVAATPPQVSWKAISAGWERSCGIRTDGKSYCWGRNDFGQLGDGTFETRLEPTLVAGNLRFSSIAVGSGHSCGITSDSVYCWGANIRGQLGDGSTDPHAVPTKVTGNITFSGVVVGVNYSCAWTPRYQGYCWGENQAGQLGDGTSMNRMTPVLFSSDFRLRSISAGATHTCADSLGGQLFCWGANSQGQLGDGSNTSHNIPTPVADPTRFSSPSLGNFHGCALTLDGPNAIGGIAYCVGRNDLGQLGNGFNISRDSLTKVSGNYRFLAISAGAMHTCGIIQGTRALRCWGQNTSQQLGDGSTTHRNTPAKVLGSHRFVAVSSGWRHTCGITAQGQAYCWGLNSSGQLGDGTTTSSSTPLPVKTPK